MLVQVGTEICMAINVNGKFHAFVDLLQMIFFAPPVRLAAANPGLTYSLSHPLVEKTFPLTSNFRIHPLCPYRRHVMERCRRTIKSGSDHSVNTSNLGSVPFQRSASRWLAVWLSAKSCCLQPRCPYPPRTKVRPCPLAGCQR